MASTESFLGGCLAEMKPRVADTGRDLAAGMMLPATEGKGLGS